MALQQKAIQRLLLTLKGTHNSNPTELLDAAVLSCRSRYHTIQEVIDECLQQRNISSSYTEFLKTRCGIDLNNEDTGALLGFDACGDISKSAISIIPETDITNWKMPETQEVVYGVLKVIYPDLSDLNADEEFMVGCLHTWWIERAINLIARSYGFEFNGTNVTPKELTVEFKAEGVGVLAYIETTSNLITGKVDSMKLVINTDYYVNMDNTNPNGVSITYPGAGYLDRTIVHEFVHAVMATNIDFFQYLAQDYLWFTEGSAELIHGIDDERKNNIQAVVSDESRFAQAFTSSPVDEEDVYSAGYVLLRYMLRQISNGYTQRYRIKRHLMIEKGNVKSLEEVGEAFIKFAQRSNNGVQAWIKMIPERWASIKTLSSFYGETLKIPMQNHADIMAEDKYYFLLNSLMKNTSTDIDFIDVLTAQYQKINVNEDYTVTDLDDVSSKITALNIDEQSHIMFSGCEGEIVKGTSLKDILSKLKNVVEQIGNLEKSRPSLVLAPTEDMFNGDVLRDEYKALLNNSAISRKLTMVCIGDSLTDPDVATVNISWTNFCQDLLPNLNIINKGIGGNQTADALARFDRDVIALAPDICFLLIGGNDLWEADATKLATAKSNFSEMVDRCLNNDIIPIIATYLPTLEQVAKFVEGSTTAKPPLQIHQNYKEYRTYCKQVANDKHLLCVDNVYSKLFNIGTGSINKEYVLPDLIHFTKAGKKIVGEYIASKIKDFVCTKQSGLNQDYDIINLYDVFCKKLGVEELTKTQFDTLVNNGQYKEIDWITEEIFSEGLLRPFNCPCFYVSLEHQNITNKSYSNWLYQVGYNPGNVYPYIYTASYRNSPVWKSRNIYYQSEKYPHNYSLKNENLFKNTGEFLAFGLHTLYDDNLWMCEQGGITCEEEATKQNVNMKWICKEMHRDSSGYPVFPSFSDLPVYPGTGCPWLTISDENKEEFDVDAHGITYWFTKSNYDATITIRVDDGALGATAYQSISLGMMTSINDDSYLFPLYVAGGTEGISEEMITYAQPYSSGVSNKNGNMYDLDIKCPAMSNSNLLTPTKFNDAELSNFKVLAPSGVWQNIYTWQQTVAVYPRFKCGGGQADGYCISLNEPTQISTDENSIHLFSGDFRNMIDTYTINDVLSKRKHSSPLEKVVVNLANSLVDGNSNNMGVIPNCYGSWYRTLDVGEIEIEGKKYLSIPNGWETRLWYYPYYNGIYPQSTIHWKSKDMANNWDEILKLSSKKMMTHRLLIPLEEEGE